MNPVDPQSMLSATVSCIAHPADPTTIRAENIDTLLPDEAEVESARRVFEDLGFETGSPYAGSFAITAPRARFVHVFAPDQPDAFDDDWFASASPSDLEMAMPDALDSCASDSPRPGIVFFTAPPDFGPTYP